MAATQEHVPVPATQVSAPTTQGDVVVQVCPIFATEIHTRHGLVGLVAKSTIMNLEETTLHHAPKRFYFYVLMTLTLMQSEWVSAIAVKSASHALGN